MQKKNIVGLEYENEMTGGRGGGLVLPFRGQNYHGTFLGIEPDI